MKTHAVVEVGGKQYLVKKDDVINVQKLHEEIETELTLPILMTMDSEKGDVELGTPTLKTTAKATVVDHMRGNKIRVARFKSKVRYRKVTGFRADLTKIKITSI